MATALGIVIHFVLSSGVAKVWVGGGAYEWTRPATMRTYLNTYRPSKTAGPISPIASAWVSARRFSTLFDFRGRRKVNWVGSG